MTYTIIYRQTSIIHLCHADASAQYYKLWTSSYVIDDTHSNYIPLVATYSNFSYMLNGTIGRLYILFYKRTNHEESFRVVKINQKNLLK